jgi:L-threonylcarbamoyladenylate synthase
LVLTMMTHNVRVYNDDITGEIRMAAEAIRSGLLVAFPTETVYGLGADCFNPTALARVFEVKGRPRFDPLIVHIAELGALDRVADTALVNDRILDLLVSRFWPGPLTLILPKRPLVPDLVTSGLPTVAVRLPAHSVALRLIRLSTGAVAAPSANPFGYLSPTRAEHVRAQLGNKVDYILDGGPSSVGVESTVLDLCAAGRPRILRPGGVSREDLEALIGPVESGTVSLASENADGNTGGNTISPSRSPGQLKSHYAPRTVLSVHSRFEMIALPYTEGEARLFFDVSSRDAWLKTAPASIPKGYVQVLSETGNLTEAAARLFDLLHELDILGASRLRVEQVPARGLGLAINDRLFRAAAAGENR